MDIKETKKKILNLIQEIDAVEYTDTFDDMKDIELLESFITQYIFDYCRENGYEINGFPFAQMERIANQEPGYDEDFMTYDRMDLYIHRLALVKEDVFELCSLSYKYLYKETKKENILEELQGVISIMEEEGIALDITEEELELWNKIEEPYRPKLP